MPPKGYGTPKRTAARFWSRVMLQGRGECALWLGAQTASGHGVFWWNGKSTTAHRYAYESIVGPIPADCEIDHLCRVRACVNPSHLEPVSHVENVQRGIGGWNSTFRTHCPRGHEYTPENTFLTAAGSRGCRECKRERTREWRRARRAS